MLRVPHREPTVDSGRATLDDVLSHIIRPAWHADALCREPEYRRLSWISRQGEDVSEQKAVCARCAVRAECLAAAMADCELGIWGGTGARERMKLRGAQRKAAA